MNERTATIEISLSKGKLVKLLVFSILFVIAGLWLIITRPEIRNPVFNNFFVKTVAAYGAAIMGSFGIYFFATKLFDKRPGMVIDDEGITDNSGALSVGLIPWEDIAEIFESTVHASFASKERFVTIGLKDPQQYILRETNTIKRKILALNLKSYCSPIHISTNGLKVAHEELLQLMQERLEEYKDEAEGNKKTIDKQASL